jgi:hypothetical protein
MAVLWPWRACSACGARGRVPRLWRLGATPNGLVRVRMGACFVLAAKRGRLAPFSAGHAAAATPPALSEENRAEGERGRQGLTVGVGDDRLAVLRRVEAALRWCGAVQNSCVGVAVRVVVFRSGGVLPPPPGSHVLLPPFSSSSLRFLVKGVDCPLVAVAGG